MLCISIFLFTVASVAVVVAVTVAVAASVGGFGAVEQQGHVLELAFIVVAVDDGQHVALQQAGTHDEQGEVGPAGNDAGIGHHLDGRTVDEDIVVVAAQGGDELFHARAEEEFRRVGGQGAYGDDVRSAFGRAGYEDRTPVGHLAVQVVGDTGMGRLHVAAERGAAQVEVEHQDALLLQGEAGGQVHADEGLAAAAVDGGDHHDTAVRVGAHHELEVGAHHAEGFVDGVAAAAADHEGGGSVGGFLPGGLLARLGNLADKGQVEVFYILAAAHAGVHCLAQEDADSRQQQADGEGYEQNLALAGRRREGGAAGSGDDAGVVGGEGLRQLVLLTFLEQVEVEFLLDLLLTFDGQQVLGLRGVAGQLADGGGFLRAQVGNLGVESLDLVVYRLEDGRLHVAERGGEVLHQRVLLATVGQQTVAVHHDGVVLADLLTDVVVLEAGAGGQGLGERLLDQLAADVLDSAELAVQGQQFTLVLGALRQILRGGCLDVGQEVFALEGGNVFVDVAQLALDDAEAVGDELRGADGDLVLVLDPVFVVDLDEGIQQVFGLADGGIADAEVDDGGLLVAQAGLKGGSIGVGGSLQAALAVGDVAADPLGGEGGGGDGQGADGSRQGVAGLDAEHLVPFTVALAEAGDTDSVGIGGAESQRDADTLFGAQEADVEGRLPVELAVTKPLAHGIGFVQAKAAHHFGHQRGRLQGEQLVVDVGVALEKAQVLEFAAEVAATAVLAVVLDEDGGGAGIERGSGHQVEDGDAQGDADGKNEPVPLGQEQGPEVLQAQKVVGRTGFLGRRNVFGHIGWG